MRLCTLAALCGLFVACDDTDFAGGGGGGNGGVVANPDFCTVRLNFEEECTVCHSASLPLGGLDLETAAYSALFNVNSSVDDTQTLVVPGDAANSLLYTMMAGSPPNGLSPMPKGGSINLGFAELVETWINNGADDCAADALLEDTGGGGE